MSSIPERTSDSRAIDIASRKDPAPCALVRVINPVDGFGLGGLIVDDLAFQCLIDRGPGRSELPICLLLGINTVQRMRSSASVVIGGTFDDPLGGGLMGPLPRRVRRLRRSSST